MKEILDQINLKIYPHKQRRFMSEKKTKRDLANPAGPRKASDKLDDIFWKDGYKDTSCSRGIIHGIWHAGAGAVRGSKDEFSRAGEQFAQCSKLLLKSSSN